MHTLADPAAAVLVAGHFRLVRVQASVSPAGVSWLRQIIKASRQTNTPPTSR
jgi:hypothetical protein